MATSKKDLSPSWHVHVRNFFTSHPEHIFTKTDLTHLLGAARHSLGIPHALTGDHLIEVLQSLGILEVRLLKHDPPASTGKRREHYAPFIRYTSRRADGYQLGLSLRANSYISHASALWLHGLLDQQPTSIYLNKEQAAKTRPHGSLTQHAIDVAFKNPARESKYVFSTKGQRFVLINGKNTNRAGVITFTLPNGVVLPITTVERSLIDATVRPIYAGGVRAVLDAFKKARQVVSVDELVKLLTNLNYLYPYHQSIGFYMTRAGYKRSAIEAIKLREIEFGFYLANAVTKSVYDETWRVHYPDDLNVEEPHVAE